MQMEGVIATMDGVGAMAEAIADDMHAHEPHGDSFFLTGGGRETTQVDEDVMLAEEVSVPPSLANTSRLILRFLACWVLLGPCRTRLPSQCMPPCWLNNTNCTTLTSQHQLHRTVSDTSLNGNMVRNFPTHGQLSAAQGNPTTVPA